MHMTLRSAHRLIKRIQPPANDIQVDSVGSLSLYEVKEAEEIREWVNEQQTKMHTLLADKLQLVEALFNIRGLIAEANSQSGINQLLTKRQSLLMKLKVFNAFKDELTDPYIKPLNDTAVIELAQRTRESEHINKPILEVTVKNEKFIAEIKEQIIVIQNELDKIDDNLATANAGTKIELDTELVRMLSTHGLA